MATQAKTGASSNASGRPGKGASAGQKRKRAAVTSDSLFAAADDDDEEEEEEEEDEQPARSSKASAQSRKAPPQPPRAKARHAAEEDEDEEGDEDASGSAAASGAPKKRRTAPEERTFKKPVAPGLVVTALPQFNVEKHRRDPRFDPMCGDFDPLHFQRHYEWVTEEKQKEIAEWQAELRSGKKAAVGGKGPRLTDEEREELRAKVQRAQQEITAARRSHSENTLLQQWKRNERKAQKETGKAPYHLKASEVKKVKLAAKYLDLKQNNKLQEFMLKKTKEVANRDHRYMPHEGREG